VCEGEEKTTFLFGNDLDLKVENCEKEEKRAQKLGGHQNNVTTSKSKPFLGQQFPKGNQFQLPQQSI
jgi:hypothetical protein